MGCRVSGDGVSEEKGRVCVWGGGGGQGGDETDAHRGEEGEGEKQEGKTKLTEYNAPKK